MSSTWTLQHASVAAATTCCKELAVHVLMLAGGVAKWNTDVPACRLRAGLLPESPGLHSYHSWMSALKTSRLWVSQLCQAAVRASRTWGFWMQTCPRSASRHVSSSRANSWNPRRLEGKQHHTPTQIGFLYESSTSQTIPSPGCSATHGTTVSSNSRRAGAPAKQVQCS